MILEEFTIEVSEIVEQLKPRLTKLHRSGVNPHDITWPELYPGFTRNAKEFRECDIHAKGLYPYELFKNIAPNQTKEEEQYIESTFQPNTKNTFQNFSNTVKRAFINGYVEWPRKNGENDSTQEEFQDYVTKEIPQYGSLEFFMSNLADEKLTDANAICGVLPNFSIENDEEDGEVINGVNPTPTIYHTDRVYFNDGESYIVLSYEKSIVTEGRNQRKVGLVFIGFTPTEIFWARQVGKRSDYRFEFTSWEHEVGFTPAVRLVGMPVMIEDKLSFTSPFYSAVPNLNLATLDNANLLIIKRKVGYPTRVFIAETCQHQEHGSTCDQGVIRWSDGDGLHSEQCSSCRGTGKVGVFSPQSELMINMAAENPESSTQVKASDAMAYISPSVDIPKYLREEIDSFQAKAEEILHLRAEPRGSGDISATEKNIDVKNTEAFIKPISDQLWFIYGYILDTIGNMMYTEEVYESIKPTVMRAERFDIVTPEDFMLQIAEARDKGLPEIIINSLVYNYLRASSFDDSETANLFQLMEQSDPILSLTPEQIAIGLSRGTIERWEVILHQKGVSLIMGLIRENEDFFEQEIDVQIEQLQSAARAAEPTNEVILPPPTPI